jgi:hypothetical protein
MILSIQQENRELYAENRRLRAQLRQTRAALQNLLDNYSWQPAHAAARNSLEKGKSHDNDRD